LIYKYWMEKLLFILNEQSIIYIVDIGCRRNGTK